MQIPYLKLSFSIFCAVFVWAMISCSSISNTPKDTVRGDMVDAYKTSSELYSYVWSPKLFKEKRFEKRILKLIDRLVDDFHRVEMKTPVSDFEPGFRISLLTQQEMLGDIRKRFKDGNKEYANWQLRSLSTNCMSCHSRIEDRSDFFGSPLTISENTVDGKMAAAEFLIATRQFNQASNDLFEMAKQLTKVEAGRANALAALKLWMVIQVRVKNNEEKASRELADFAALTSDKADVINAWVYDLSQIVSSHAFSMQGKVRKARELIQPVLDEQMIVTQERHLVKTLEATQILHQTLKRNPPMHLRREATCLLAQAYNRLPIRSLEAFASLYLEQCIREYPRTEEAQGAYERYKERLELLSSGSGGLHLEEEDLEKMRKLRLIAYGRPELILNDSSTPIE